MARERYAERLCEEERARLTQLVRSGKSSARIVARARVLLKVDEGWNAPQMATALDVVPRQLYLPVGVNQFCRFTSLAWPRCWAALVR